MGASVKPESAGDRITRNIEAMRAQGATDDDIEAYLTQHEGLTPEPAPAKPTMPVPGVAADASRALARNRPNASGDLQAATNNLGEQGKFLARGLTANILNAAQGIPGMEAAEAGMMSLGSKLTDQPMGYRESLATLRNQTERIPKAVSLAEKFAGGGALAKAIPIGPTKTVMQALKSGAKVGAGYGAADAALAADPDLTTGDRAVRGALGGATGAVLGGAIGGGAKAASKIGGLISTAKRVKAAPTLGETAQSLDQDITDATIKNYGQAAAEGEAAGGTSPALAKALEHPRVKPFAELVRDGEEGSPTSDADVAREVYKLMSKQRRGLKDFMDRNGYDAAKDREVTKIANAMKQLKSATAEASTMTTPAVIGEAPAMETALSPKPDIRTALKNFEETKLAAQQRNEGTIEQQMARKALERHHAENIASPPLRGAPPGPRTFELEPARETEVPPVMPSFPTAVAEKARMEGERNAFNTSADAARRAMLSTSVQGKKLLTQSPEAFAKSLDKMTPEEAKRALAGALGRGKEALSGLTLSPRTGFGIGRSALRFNRLQPLLGQIDQKVGTPPRSALDVEAILRRLGLLNTPLANP